ncbi:MAG TPA: hypothetical protein VFM18_11835 [Methanosarcina sp.]|nr:hypothetical protein [Methanosarcina sp.]
MAGKNGGARPGAGRPKGSTNKIKIEDIMQCLELEAGMTYPEQLAYNYVEAINRKDWNSVRDYDKAFMNKLVADKQEIEVIEPEDVVEAKKKAFAEAIAEIAGVKLATEESDNDEPTE